MKSTGRSMGKGTRQILYAIIAALLCFVGPTYFVAAASRVIPQIYGMTLGLVIFLVGIFFVFKLVEE
jgi:hypothetical protein